MGEIQALSVRVVPLDWCLASPAKQGRYQMRQFNRNRR